MSPERQEAFEKLAQRYGVDVDTLAFFAATTLQWVAHEVGLRGRVIASLDPNAQEYAELKLPEDLVAAFRAFAHPKTQPNRLN